MKTLNGILSKINSWIITNGQRLITAIKLNEILTDLKTYLSDSRVVFGRYTAASFTDLDITQINAGDVIDGITIATGDLILLCNQDDNLENGLYIIGQNPGGTVRHADFPDVIACADTVFYGKDNTKPLKCYLSGSLYVFSLAVTEGHIIQGGNTAFPQRSVLLFENCSVEDDAINQRTKVIMDQQSSNTGVSKIWSYFNGL